MLFASITHRQESHLTIQVEEILIWIRDQKTKKQGNKGTAEKWQTIKQGCLYLQIY